MVYGIIQLINFAHGEVLMVGALTSWSIIGMMQEAMPGAPGWLILLLATVIACVVAAALNFSIEKMAYKPLRNSPRLAPLITAIGMSILLQTLAMIIWKPNYKPYPTLLPAAPFQVGGAVITTTQIMILGVTAISLAVLMYGELHQARPRHARHGREPARGLAHGRQARHGDLGHLHHRRRSGHHRRHDVCLQLRHGAAHHGLFCPASRPSRRRCSAASATWPARWWAASCWA
jgi:hypothetical protein